MNPLGVASEAMPQLVRPPAPVPEPRPLQHPRLASMPPGMAQNSTGPGPGMAQALGSQLMQLLAMPEGNFPGTQVPAQGQTHTSMHVITGPTVTRVASPPTKAPPPVLPTTHTSASSQSGPSGAPSSSGASTENPQASFAQSISAMMQSLGPQLMSRLSPPQPGTPVPMPQHINMHGMMMPMEAQMMPMGFPPAPTPSMPMRPSMPHGPPAPRGQGTSTAPP
mmetsp:Transcript_103554/g.161445  ORF Transcript_103554/g.161445 Transcript_103554/m.161445 type:complete len:222 (+) Transcript_103554:2-667(+)